MYQLLIYDPGASAPRATVGAQSAADVHDLIPRLLEEHEGCGQVVVMMLGTRLFAVDCAGSTTP